MLLVIVVDDISIARKSREALSEIKRNLSFSFQVKLLGDLRPFIGWGIERTPRGIFVHQALYINSVIANFNLQHVNAQNTPLPSNADLSPTKSGEKPLSKSEHDRYRSLIGSLLYAAI